MIGRLRGEVIDRSATSILVDVNGVGYQVHVTAQCPFRIGERVDVFIHTNVRDDAIQLFGFADAIEREVFNYLIGVQSVGPVKAMAILQTPVADFIELVLRREPARLSKLPGVGKKTAERILIDLYDKLQALSPSLSPSAKPSTSNLPASAVGKDLVSALVNLGYREAVAEETAAAAIGRKGEDASLEVLLKDALSKGR